MMKITNFIKWAICFDIDGNNYDDGKKRTSIVAIFKYSYEAEDYIKTLPNQDTANYYVSNIDDLSDWIK